MKSFAALAAIVPLVAAHGFIKSPAPRQPGDAFRAACGDQPYYQQSSDINGNVQGILQVVGSDFDASACNLWLCKGFQLADNTDLVQSYTAGETVDFAINIAAPHTGYANVSVVKTSTNSIIGTPLIEFSNYASNAGMPANNTAFSVTIPDDLGSECSTAGDCVLQWFWDAADINQTYESCVDFTVGGSSSGGSGSGSASSAVASSAAPAVTSAAATTAVAAVTETGVVTSAITPVAASSAAAEVTSEAPAATTSAVADDEECPADEDEGDDEDAGDDEECPADEDEGDDEGDDEDDCEDDGEETTIESTVVVAPTVAAVSVVSSAAAQVTSAAASYVVPSAAQSGSSGSGNGSGNGAAVTSYVTVTGKPHTKTHVQTKYVTVTADAPACT